MDVAERTPFTSVEDEHDRTGGQPLRSDTGRPAWSGKAKSGALSLNDSPGAVPDASISRIAASMRSMTAAGTVAVT